MAYKQKIKKKKTKVSKLYNFYLNKHFSKKTNEELTKERENLKFKVKNNINTNEEFNEYIDLSYYLYKDKMNEESFRNKVYAGEI